jgi:hypothetical protein
MRREPDPAGTIPGTQLYLTGPAAIEHDLDPVFSRDLKVGELYIAIPIGCERDERRVVLDSGADLPSRPRSFADAVSMIPTAAAESGALHQVLGGGTTGAIVDHACGSLVD